jgi:O-antigen ligase
MFILLAMLNTNVWVGPIIPIVFILLLAYFLWGITGPVIFTVVLFIRPGEVIHPALLSIQFAKITAAACLGFWFIHFFFFKKRYLSKDPMSLLMLGFTIAIVICSFKSTHSAHSQFQLIDIWLKILILFLAIANLASSPSAFRVYVSTTIFLSMVLAILGIHKGLTATPDQLIEGRVGVGSLLSDPNDFAQMLIVSGLPYFLNCVFLAPSRKLKAIFLVCFLVVTSSIYFTKSRGGFLGFAGATIVVMHSRVSTPMLIGTIGAMGVLGAVFVIVTKRQSAVGEIDESAQGRLDTWKSALRMFMHNPIFGVGFHTFIANYLSYAQNPIMWKPTDTHNSWLKIIAELGIIGSIFFFPLVAVSLFQAAKLERWAREQQLSAQGYWYMESLLRSIFPALVGWSISGTFLSNSYSWFLYISIAILVAALSVKNNWQAAHSS